MRSESLLGRSEQRAGQHSQPGERARAPGDEVSDEAGALGEAAEHDLSLR